MPKVGSSPVVNLAIRTRGAYRPDGQADEPVCRAVEHRLSAPASRLADMVRGRPEPDPQFVARVGEVALGLPDAHEEDAWTGVRWRIRQRTFAHVVALHHDAAAKRLGITDG